MSGGERCGRGHKISWANVDTYCSRCQEEMPVEIERLRAALRDTLMAIDNLLPAWLNGWEPAQDIIDQAEAAQEVGRALMSNDVSAQGLSGPAT